MDRLFDAEEYSGKRVAVALSGGVDSVSLLHAFKIQAERYAISLSAVHVEHGIRGEESVRDLHFCEALCGEWNIPLRIVREDVPALVKAHGGSVEEVARTVRYRAFRALLGEVDLVATAHHLDDVAETVLFRLARGTGLSGMRAITEYGGIVRPLLSLSRAEIEAYAAANSLPHIEDSTNGDEKYARNYIRKRALPAFEQIHEGAKENLVRFASLAAEEDEFLRTLAEQAVTRRAGETRIPASLPDVLFCRACHLVLQEADAAYDASKVAEVGKLRTAQSGKRITLQKWGDGTFYAVREGAEIVFYKEQPKEAYACPFLPKAGEYSRPAPFRILEERAGTVCKNGEGRLYVDLDAFPADCCVRTRREGDEFTPFAGPKKSLKKFLSDRKIPARISRHLPVIACGSEVLVVVGAEISDRVKVTEKTTRYGIVLFEKISEK